MTNHLRAFTRLVLGTLHLLAGLWLVYLRFPQLSDQQRSHTVQTWAAKLLRVIAIELRVSGAALVPGPVLLVANHLSWLDIVVLLASTRCSFLSKSEIRQWPVVGALANGAGTLYIERTSSRSAMRVVHHMAERLRSGGTLAVFPEGAIGDGHAMLPFHANVLQAAISADALVQPLALRYADAATGKTSFAPRFTNAESLLVSVWRTLSAPKIEAHVVLGRAQKADGRDRRQWAQALGDEIQKLRGA